MATIGRSDEINCLLDSLEEQTSSAFDLIIVDQNPGGKLEHILRRLSNSRISFRHITTERKGLALARNIGFPYTKHEIIGYPDDDCWYEKEVIARVIDFFEVNPDADGLVGRWCEKDNANDTSFYLNIKQWRQFQIGIAGSSICLFMRRELVEKVAGFDERLGVPQWFGAGEETDFVIRCLTSGAKIKYLPNVRVHHPVKLIQCDSLDQVLKQVRSRSRGTGALYCKHQLSWFVIFRGLLSPFLRSFMPPYSFRAISANFMTVLGRIEGLLFWNTHRWKQREKK